MTKPAFRKRSLTPWPLLAGLALWCGGGARAQSLFETQGSEAEQIRALLAQSSNSLAAVYDYRGILVKRELFGDELVEQTIAFKFSRPFKVYVRYIEPHAGREGIYVRGSNQNRVRAHKGSIPDLPVSLNPLGPVPMDGNHHPITSFGLERMLQITARNIRKAIARSDATLSISEGGIVFGEPTWRVELESKSGGRYVIVGRAENLWDFARRVRQDMYVILHHNEDIDSPRGIRPGQKVFVPRYYGSRGEYFFSKRTFIMIKASSWDHHGKLYESYEFPELELNPGLADRDFDYRNRDYHFRLLGQR